MEVKVKEKVIIETNMNETKVKETDIFETKGERLMKKGLRRKALSFVFALMLLSLSIFASGCGNSNGGGSNGDNIDVNLSALGSTMLFAEIINIWNNPEDYMGQVIKIHGGYFNFFHEESGQYIHFVMVLDEGGCCEQGFPFRVSEDFDSPEELFEFEEEIEVIGVFSRSGEDEWGSYYLEVKELEAL